MQSGRVSLRVESKWAVVSPATSNRREARFSQ